MRQQGLFVEITPSLVAVAGQGRAACRDTLGWGQTSLGEGGLLLEKASGEEVLPLSVKALALVRRLLRQASPVDPPEGLQVTTFWRSVHFFVERFFAHGETLKAVPGGCQQKGDHALLIALPGREKVVAPGYWSTLIWIYPLKPLPLVHPAPASSSSLGS